MARAAVQDVPSQPVRPQGAAGSFDSVVLARADAAYKDEFDKWQAQIDAVLADRSLSPDQRASALRSLRLRQSVEASGARKRVIDEETQRAKVARRRSNASEYKKLKDIFPK